MCSSANLMGVNALVPFRVSRTGPFINPFGCSANSISLMGGLCNNISVQTRQFLRCGDGEEGLLSKIYEERHVLGKTLMEKPETKVEKQDEEITGTVEVIRSWKIHCAFEAMTFNSDSFDALERRKPILNNVMETLGDPDTHIIGVYGSNDEIKETLLKRVRRRVDRDKLFDVVLTVTVTKKPDVKKIQDEIAGQLGFNFDEKSKDKRAIELHDRIKNDEKILIILCDLHKGLDLGKIGIPSAADHNGCKILISSTSEELLSKQMRTQKNFMV